MKIKVSKEWCERSAEIEGESRVGVCGRRPCSAVLERIEGMDVRKVAASTQYGMGLIIVTEGAKHLLNGITYRNDQMSHGDRVTLAEEVNAILRND